VSRDQTYLRHLLDAIGKIERYAAVGYSEFMAESHWQDAVIRQLANLGEAVKRLSPEVTPSAGPTSLGGGSPACGTC